MSPCRECQEPIAWRSENGRNIPVDPVTKADHRDTCSARRGLVPDRIKRPARHAISASRIKVHEECQRAYWYALEEKRDDSSTAMESGKLAHAAIEVVAVERARAGNLSAPVTVTELLEALDAVTIRERWSGESLADARETLTKSAHRIDLSFAGVDEHGPLVERGFETPVGDGVLAGGIVDLVEVVGDAIIVTDWKTGGFREPSPHRLPAVGLYAAWARSLWPGREVRVVLRYLSLDVDDEVGGSDLERAEGDAKATARALVLKTRTKRANEAAWPGTFGGACVRCPFTARCETYQAAMSGDTAGEPRTAEELTAWIHRVAPVASTLSSLVSARRKALIEIVGPSVNAHGRMVVGNYPVRVKTISREGYMVKPSTYQQIDIDDPVGAEPDASLLAGVTVDPEAEPALVTDDSLTWTHATVRPAVQPEDVRDLKPENIHHGALGGGPVATSGTDAGAPEGATGMASTEAQTLSAEAPSHSEPVAPCHGSGVAAPTPTAGAKSPDSPAALAPIPCCVCGDEATVQSPSLHPDACNRDGCALHRLCATCAVKAAEDAARPETAPAAPLNSIDALKRLCREATLEMGAMVDLMLLAGDDASTGKVGSRVLNQAIKVHGKDRVEEAWALVGGQMTEPGVMGSKPRRKPLTGRQLRALVGLMPELAPPVDAQAPIKAITDALDELNAGSPQVGGM